MTPSTKKPTKPRAKRAAKASTNPAVAVELPTLCEGTAGVNDALVQVAATVLDMRGWTTLAQEVKEQRMRTALADANTLIRLSKEPVGG